MALDITEGTTASMKMTAKNARYILQGQHRKDDAQKFREVRRLGGYARTQAR